MHVIHAIYTLIMWYGIVCNGDGVVLCGVVWWDRSKWVRFRDLGMDNKVPGPGQYFDGSQDVEVRLIRADRECVWGERLVCYVC